jgi:hypothetical protein
MVRRLGLVAAVISLGLSLGWSTAASAAYDPNAIGISTNSSATCDNGSLTVTGVNFEPNESVTLSLPGPVTLATAAATPDGSWSTAVTIPPNTTPGQSYSIVATGSSGDSASTSVSVTATCTAGSGLAFTPGDPGSGSGLAFTGADIAAVSTVGAIALALGGLLVLTGRRRRTSRV